MGYEDLIFNYVKVMAPSVIVFLLLALTLDYMYRMIFKN